MHDPIHRRSFLCRAIAFSAVSSSVAALAQPSRAGDQDSADDYPQSIPEVSWRRDLSGNISADRPLTLADLDLVLKLSDYLIGTAGWASRVNAARDLGRLAHKYGLPALLAVARDESEQPGLRSSAVVALSRICDKRAVDYLINEALGEEPGFDHLALEGLIHLVGKPPELHDPSFAGAVRHPPKDPAKRQEYLKIWQEWWTKNRDEIELGLGPDSIYQ